MQFTQDWFSHVIPCWTEVLKELPSHRNYLEIGSFEGRSAAWLLANSLDADGFLTCVDTWQGQIYPKVDMDGAFERFRSNTEEARKPGQTVIDIRGMSSAVLPALPPLSFDFIYVDGSHHASDVLMDICLSWLLLKQGGFLAMDDYVWGEPSHLLERPKLAVDSFVNIFAPKLEILSIGSQFIIKKLKE